MRETPNWLDLADIEDQIDEREQRREKALERREECLTALEEGDIEHAESQKREYQLAAYETRQAEGEILWGAIGHAVTDLVQQGADPGDSVVTERGYKLLQWAVDSDVLHSIRNSDRIRLVLARRFPSAPDPHEPYLKSMLGVTQEDIANLRDRDRQMLKAAGWLRRGRTDASTLSQPSCPRCGEPIPVRISSPDSVTISETFTGTEEEMREICPHCERDIFVSTGGSQTDQ